MNKKKILLMIISSLILILIFAGENSFPWQPNSENSSFKKINPEFIENEILVRFKEGVSTNQITLLNEKLGASTYKVYSFPDGLKIYHLKLKPKRISTQKALQEYKMCPEVVYATYNYTLHTLDSVIPHLSPNDPYFKNQWALENTGQNGGREDADIDGPEAWYISAGNNKIVIAVIDTGIQIDHPDLASNIWTNPGEIPDNGIDDDRNGYIDDVHGWDFKNDDNSVYDGIDWHGTHVAGIIGAIGNNGIGIAGINWRVKIMPLKFLEYGVGQSADAIEAFAYAAQKGVKIISNSWGRWGAPDPAMEDAIRSSGALCIFAAGNSGKDNDAGYPYYTNYPSSYPLNNIIAVAASDSSDNLVSTYWGSNWGKKTVDLAAPGLDILSTFPTDKSNPPYKYASGTSMAAPYVAGVAALVKGRFLGKTPEQIKEMILNSVDQNNNLKGRLLSGGRLNAHNCLIGQGDGTPPETHFTTLHPSSNKLTANTPTIEVYFAWEGSDNLTPKEKLLYSYFMEGYDEGWSPWTYKKNITYFLPQGEYTFKVRACDEAGNFPDEESSSIARHSFQVSLPLIVYPNPLRSGQNLKIANIPLGSLGTKVYIYDISGRLVKILEEGEGIKKEGGSFTATWDCHSKSGEEIGRGIYLYLIYDGNSQRRIGKIAVLD